MGDSYPPRLHQTGFPYQKLPRREGRSSIIWSLSLWNNLPIINLEYCQPRLLAQLFLLLLAGVRMLQKEIRIMLP